MDILNEKHFETILFIVSVPTSIYITRLKIITVLHKYLQISIQLFNKY